VGKVSLGLAILDPIDIYTSDGLHFDFPTLHLFRNCGFFLQFLSYFFEFRVLRLRELHATNVISVGVSTFHWFRKLFSNDPALLLESFTRRETEDRYLKSFVTRDTKTAKKGRNTRDRSARSVGNFKSDRRNIYRTYRKIVMCIRAIKQKALSNMSKLTAIAKYL